MNYLDEELFCQGLELKSFAELMLKSESERMMPGFSLDVIEHDHKERYLFVSEFTKNKKVLDIACGVGYGANLLYEIGKASKVIGVDLDELAIRYASHRFKSDGVTYLQANAEIFDTVDRFDLITSFETIEHIPDYVAFLRNISRLLTNEGSFFVSTPISRLDLDEHPIDNPYHIREWGFMKFQEVISTCFDIEDTFVQLYQHSFINEKNILAFNQSNTKFKNRLRNLLKLKILNIKDTPILLNDWTSKTNYSQIEKFTDQYSVHDLGKKHTGYQILKCKKKI